MDDIAESLITRFISQLKVRLVEVFEVFDLELWNFRGYPI